MTSLTLQRSDTDNFPFLRSWLVVVKRSSGQRGHVKKVSIVELDHGYAVCRLKNFRMLYWIMDANDMQYVNRTDVRTHARMHRTGSNIGWKMHLALSPFFQHQLRSMVNTVVDSHVLIVAVSVRKFCGARVHLTCCWLYSYEDVQRKSCHWSQIQSISCE